MALLVYFKRIREDDAEVEYLYGGDKEALEDVLVIEKSSRRLRSDQVSNHLMVAAAAKIVSQAALTGRWPGFGVRAS
ncbi:hypothetical protein LTV02_26955 [Nocardia yamanashiensis]|uniref:hypothetical protein n=1 Tax=Nocardia yamanashiensis TaxID=209247 RepID=UPI001E41C7B6|nr:hypothetical protein [Nocardia yamanashiensis]UGT39681.1 hypothetical protein LTV02_26955 [Nocardia yamanashiensis]